MEINSVTPKKLVVIWYYKNIKDIYMLHWIDKCIQSMENQTCQNFISIELNYGNDQDTLADIVHRNINIHTEIWQHDPTLSNHVYAMNWAINKAFTDCGADYVFNTNLDDYYEPERLQQQKIHLNTGVIDLISCDMDYIEEVNNQDQLVGSGYQPDILSSYNGKIKKELEADHNVIAHPAVAYTKKFWLTHGPYSDIIPREDLILWKKAIRAGARFYIIPKVLMHYRIHKKQITAKVRK